MLLAIGVLLAAAAVFKRRDPPPLSEGGRIFSGQTASYEVPLPADIRSKLRAGAISVSYKQGPVTRTGDMSSRIISVLLNGADYKQYKISWRGDMDLGIRVDAVKGKR